MSENYKVKNIGEAEWGRKEIAIAQSEMASNRRAPPRVLSAPYTRPVSGPWCTTPPSAWGAATA